MNLLDDLKSLMERYSKPGLYRRDGEDERAMFPYIVQFTYKHRGESKTETAVVLAASMMDAKVLATKPYSEVHIEAVKGLDLSNNVLLRASGSHLVKEKE